MHKIIMMLLHFLSQENDCEYVRYTNIIQDLTQPYSVEVTYKTEA